MNLKDYIKESITSISEAVIECQSELEDKGVIISPNGLFGNTGDSRSYVQNDRSIVTDVKFEVFLNIDEKKEKGGGIKVDAGLFKIDGQREGENAIKQGNKLEFSIPVRFPSKDVKV